MQWIEKYQLFLFDFDGLLVDTEPYHFKAYVKMGQYLSLKTDQLTFNEYQKFAHMENDGVRKFFQKHYSTLIQNEPHWQSLRKEAKKFYLECIQNYSIPLMKGVAKLLTLLKKLKIKRCVVTNSTLEQIETIKKRQPLLNTIEHWVTREDFKRPKPFSDSYRVAMDRLYKKGDKVIGFEDTMKGMNALREVDATSVLICPNDHPQIRSLPKKMLHFESFSHIPSNGLIENFY